MRCEKVNERGTKGFFKVRENVIRRSVEYAYWKTRKCELCWAEKGVKRHYEGIDFYADRKMDKSPPKWN